MTDVTRDELVARTFQLLWEPSDVEEFDEEDVVLPKIESIIKRICQGKYIHPITQQIYRWGYLPFLDAQAFYTTVVPVSLTADVATTDVTISLDASGLLDATAPAPQYVYVNWDIIQYTGKTATTITWVTGIGTTHTSWDVVYQLYKLPTGISKPYSLYRVASTQNREEVAHQDFRKPAINYRYFTILRDGTQDLLNIVGYWEDKFMMVYVNDNTVMATGATECIIPDCLDMVSSLAAWEILIDNEEYDDGKIKIDSWCALLSEMYSFHNKQTKQSQTRIKTGNPVRLSQAYSGSYGSRPGNYIR